MKLLDALVEKMIKDKRFADDLLDGTRFDNDDGVRIIVGGISGDVNMLYNWVGEWGLTKVGKLDSDEVSLVDSSIDSEVCKFTDLMDAFNRKVHFDIRIQLNGLASDGELTLNEGDIYLRDEKGELTVLTALDRYDAEVTPFKSKMLKSNGFQAAIFMNGKLTKIAG